MTYNDDYHKHRQQTERETLLREVRELRRIVAAIAAHLGVTGTHTPYR